MAAVFYRNFQHFKDTAGYEIEGRWYPRVTSIISIKAKSALYRYYAEQENFKAAERKTLQSAKEGILVHDTIESILNGQPTQIPQEIKPSIEAFLQFWDNNRIVPLKIEERVKSDKHWYAGTLDLLAEINGVLGIVDIKTSFAVFRDYNLQTAAYLNALTEAGFKNLERWILRVDQFKTCQLCGAKLRNKGGNVKIRGGKSYCPHQWGELKGEVELKKLNNIEEDFRAFLACKELWSWENGSWLKKLI
jgi:hypothetical protein